MTVGFVIGPGRVCTVVRYRESCCRGLALLALSCTITSTPPPQNRTPAEPDGASVLRRTAATECNFLVRPAPAAGGSCQNSSVRLRHPSALRRSVSISTCWDVTDHNLAVLPPHSAASSTGLASRRLRYRPTAIAGRGRLTNCAAGLSVNIGRTATAVDGPTCMEDAQRW